MKFTWKYTGLRVQDLKAAIAFYTEGLGLKLQYQQRIKETGGRIAVLAQPGMKGHYLELNWYPAGSEHATPYVPGEALDHLMFRVPRGTTMEEAIAHLEAHGGKLLLPPFREGDCLLAYVDSPDGHTIELDVHGEARQAARKQKRRKSA